MKNKILIKVYIPSIDDIHEIYISYNETILKNKKLILKFVDEYYDGQFDLKIDRFLVDSDTFEIYQDSLIIRDTNIRNGKLILLI